LIACFQATLLVDLAWLGQIAVIFVLHYRRLSLPPRSFVWHKMSVFWQFNCSWYQTSKYRPICKFSGTVAGDWWIDLLAAKIWRFERPRFQKKLVSSVKFSVPQLSL